MKIDLTGRTAIMTGAAGIRYRADAMAGFFRRFQRLAGNKRIPTAESLARHISQIDDITEFDQIVSGLGKMDSVIAQLDGGLCGSRISKPAGATSEKQ